MASKTKLSDFPPLPARPQPFPTEPPLETPLAEMSGWWLRIVCGCRGRRDYPLRLMAAKLGWTNTLGRVLPRLRCETCKEKPTAVTLVKDVTAGAAGNNTERGGELKIWP